VYPFVREARVHWGHPALQASHPAPSFRTPKGWDDGREKVDEPWYDLNRMCRASFGA